MTAGFRSLDELATALLDGRLAPSEAERLARSAPMELSEAWLDSIVTLTRRGWESAHPGTVEGIARLVAAARPVPAIVRGIALLHLTGRLLDLDPARALGCLDVADDLLGDDERNRAFAVLLRLTALVRQHDAGAADVAARAQTAAVRAGADDIVAMVLLQRAILLEQTGRLDEALTVVTEATALRRRYRADQEEAPFLLALYRFLMWESEIARHAGHYARAIDALEEARDGALAADDRSAAAFLLSEAGYAWTEAGEPDRGRALLVRAAEEALSLGDIDAAARWGGELRFFTDLNSHDESAPTTLQRAILLAEEPGGLDEAVTLARRCVAKAVQEKQKVFEAQARNVLGVLLRDAGSPVQGIVALRVAAAVAHEAGATAVEFHTRANLGNLLIQRVAKDEAEKELEAAVALGERMRTSSESGELRQTIGAALARAYEQLAQPSATTLTPGAHHTWEKTPPRPERVLEFGQRMRARNFLHWLQLGRAAIEEPHLTEDAHRSLVRLRAVEVAMEAAAGDAADLGPFLDERAAAAAAASVAVPDALGATLLDERPTIYDAAALAAHLRPGECLVDLLSLPDLLSVTCVTPDGTARTGGFLHYREERRECFSRLAAARMAALRAEARVPGGARPGAVTAYDAIAAELDGIFDEIAEEIAQSGDVRAIYVVPHTDLFQAPFWRLSSRLPGVVVRLLPATGALPVLRATAPHGGLLDRLVLVPDTSGTLHYADRDLAGVRHEVVGPQVDSLVAAGATATAVHFAGHGYFDRRNAYWSGLLLSRGDQSDPLSRPAPGRQPGMSLLTAAQMVARLDLPECRLAVLAACSTGIPRQHAASEFTSLPAALLLAGARAVVGALWPAHDGAAALQMQEFYAAMSRGLPADEALQASRTRLRELSRDEVVSRLGGDLFVPHADRPFDKDLYTDAFQLYGVA